MLHIVGLFGVLLIPPAFMAFFGFLFRKHPPKRNYLYGYRSDLSIKNDDTWRFAHENIGKRWWKVGGILLLINAVLGTVLSFFDESTSMSFALIIMMLTVAVLLVTAFLTEKALRETFTKTGERKQKNEENTFENKT